jgi:hypothetical protein
MGMATAFSAVGGWFLVVLVLVTLQAGSARSTGLEDEAHLKSSYLLNFAKLVEWPATDGDRFEIGICGDPFLWRACRKKLAGKEINGLRVSLTPMSLEDATESEPGTRLIFVYSDNQDELVSLIEALADQPVILVSDYPGFCDLGGSIGLFWEGDRMLFEINRTKATRTGLAFNSRLLRVARRGLE